MCKDFGISNCLYVARADTENGVILSMMEHFMKTHPEKVGEWMLTMTREDIMEMMRKKIQQEIV
jgi:predicted small metal-binding protein